MIVSETKRGILRYLGTTDFAKGEWAGVDLIEPLGKNDGSVSGKRSFSHIYIKLLINIIIYKLLHMYLYYIFIYLYSILFYISIFTKYICIYILYMYI